MSEISLGAVAIAENVPFETYLKTFSDGHYEWVTGTVIAMPSAGQHHNDLIGYLYILLKTYLEIKPVGKVLLSPFTMRLTEQQRGREPDLLVVLRDNSAELATNYLDGAADICIEVVSPESTDRDRGTKFTEYEQGGVTEYWLIDPIRKEALFYHLNITGMYEALTVGENSDVESKVLPKCRVNIPTLWQDDLPSTLEIVTQLQIALKSG